MRLICYADSFVVLVAGTRADAETLRDEVAVVLVPMGLRLSQEKTRVCHIGERFDVLRWRISHRNWRGRTGKKATCTSPSERVLTSVISRARALTCRARHRTLADLLRRLKPPL